MLTLHSHLWVAAGPQGWGVLKAFSLSSCVLLFWLEELVFAILFIALQFKEAYFTKRE